MTIGTPSVARTTVSSTVTVACQLAAHAAHRAILPGNVTNIPVAVLAKYQIFPTLVLPACSSVAPKIQNKIHVSQGNYAHTTMWSACIPLKGLRIFILSVTVEACKY